MTGEPVFERDAHAPLPRSGMTLIMETGEVLRVERVDVDEIWGLVKWSAGMHGDEVRGYVRDAGWIVVRVQS